MKKIIAIFIILMLFSSMFALNISAAEDIVEFSLAAKRIGNQVKLDVNVKGAAGKKIIIVGPLVIDFDGDKLSIPYESGLFDCVIEIKNDGDSGFTNGLNTRTASLDVFWFNNNQIKILYVDERGYYIAKDGTFVTLIFDIKTAGDVKFILDYYDYPFNSSRVKGVDLAEATTKRSKMEPAK